MQRHRRFSSRQNYEEAFEFSRDCQTNSPGGHRWRCVWHIYKKKNYGFASKAELIDARENFQRTLLVRKGIHKISFTVQFRCSQFNP